MVYFLVPFVGIASVPVGGWAVAKLSNGAANASYAVMRGIPSGFKGAPAYPFPPSYLRFGNDDEPPPTKATTTGTIVSALVFCGALAWGRKRNPLVRMARNMNMGAKGDASGKMETVGHFAATNMPGIAAICTNCVCSGIIAGAVSPLADS